MSIFVTQSVESSVAVLVFARPGPIVEALRSALQAKHLDVVVADPLLFSEKEAAVLGGQYFYKTCWIFDDSLKGTSQADLVFQFLFSRKEPVVILTATLSEDDFGPEWVSKREGDNELISHLKKNLKSALILVAVNWLDQPTLFVSPLYFFVDALTASDSLKSGVETELVIDHLSTVLLRPHQPELDRIERKKTFSSSTFEPFFVATPRSESRVPPEIVQETKSFTYTEETFYQEEALPQPTWYPEATVYQEIEEFETAHRDVQVRVFPLSSPMIPNRQRLYEENINRIKQRTQKQRLLRPVPKKKAAAELPKLPATPTPAGELQPIEQHLEVTIQQLFGNQRQVQRADRLEKKVTKTVRAQRKQVRQKKAMAGVAVLIGLCVTVGVLVGSFIVMRAQLFNLILNQADSENLADQSVWQSWQTQALVNALATEIQAYQYIGGAESLPETAAVVSAVRQMQTIHQQRQELHTLTEQSVSQVLGKSAEDVFETVTALAAQQQTLYSSLSVIQTQLQSISVEFLAENEQKAIEKILAEIQQTRRQVATFEQIRQLLPAFLAQNERRRVAIVLQDSQELRPSGGRVEGVYLVTLEKGVVIDQQFFTSQQIEGDKSAKLTAPADYQKLVNSPDLPLGDAGWGPDFTDTATSVNGLLEHTLGRKADLLVGVTTNTLQEIIEKTGPLVVDKTTETLTDKNFFERVESHPEPEYLSTIFVALMQRLFEQPVQASEALSVISNQWQTGQAFLVSAQPTENDVLNSLGWAGKISTPQCPSLLGTESCQISTIYQLEANIGLNKVGSLIQRSIHHTVEVGKDQIRHKRQITFTNQANSTRWPSGAYKDYLRFYLPADAQLVMIRVGDSLVDLKTIETGTDKGGQFIGFVVDVPIKSKVDVFLEYSQPFKYAAGSGFAFFDQKQAGTQPDDYTLTVVPQDGLQAGVIAPKAELKNGQIIFKLAREKHQFVGIKFR